ncbi:hypothetical protein ACFSSA_13510 [Luteolibacter algae]|uniref:Uncharacterized protein n=2 Tax=Luteolibacter algae TaxID=454151 RepID=A0ABW5DE90_9BACT
MTDELEGMDPEALSFRAILPAKYQFLVASYRTRQDQLEIDESGFPKKREAEILADTMLSSIQRQQEIDAHRLSLQVNGQNLDITQGELRRIMEKRLEELREIRESMIQGGAGSAEISALDETIQKYDETIDDLADGRADATVEEAVQELIEADPGFAEMLENHSNPSVEKTSSVEIPRTSFAAEQFGDETMQTFSLSDAFSRGGELPEQPSTEINQPGFDDRPLDQSLEKLGF